MLEQPINTSRIAKSIDGIIELCSEATAMRMSVMLAWPILIAGLYCDNTLRPSITALFESFQYDYCEDLKTAVSGDHTKLIPACYTRPAMEINRFRTGQTTVARDNESAK